MLDFIAILQEHLPRFKDILELGSKKGNDLKFLDEYYEVVASENDKLKTRYLKDTFIDIRVILLDSIKVDTHKKFDCIFSNEILCEYNLDDIKQSFENQRNVLNENGIIFHIFHSVNTNRNEILKILKKNYFLIKSEEYDNKFYILARLL